jgi:NADPH:quinone reductase-like Zn-dependent oxidoreductase
VRGRDVAGFVEAVGKNVIRFQPGNLRSSLASLFVPQRLTILASKERGEGFDASRKLIGAGKVTPVIERTYPLSEAPRGDPLRRGRPQSRQGRHHRLMENRRRGPIPNGDVPGFVRSDAG